MILILARVLFGKAFPFYNVEVSDKTEYSTFLRLKKRRPGIYFNFCSGLSVNNAI